MDRLPAADRPGFLRRHALLLAGLALLAAGALTLASFLGKKNPAPRRAAEAPVVRITPPPPPPPPKPPEPKPDEPKEEPAPSPDKIIDQPEPAPAAPSPDPAPAAEAMGTSIAGSGDDGFGLAYNRTGGGNTIGGGGSGRTGGSADARADWTAYALRIRPRLTAALAEHKTTRAAALAVKLRLWAEADGRIARVELAESTGDRDLDTALTREVFTGLRLEEPPPPGLPMPIVLRLSGRRP